MWNLNENDIKKAKDELEARRATLMSKHEEEMKRIDAELVDLDMVECVAMNFVSSHKGGDSPSNSTESEEPSEFDPVPAEQKGSRWRMHLGTEVAK